MAAVDASQMSNRFTPGPSRSAMNTHSSRAPAPGAGPSSYGTTGYPMPGRPGGHPYNPVQPSMHTHPVNPNIPPELRVISPSVEGDDEWDDERSIYSTRTSNYYPDVFQPQRTSGQQSIYSTSTSGQSFEYRDSWQTNGTARPDSNVDPFAFRSYETRMQLPKVIVSSPSEASFHRQSGVNTSNDTRLADISEIPKAITPPPVVQVEGRVPSAVQGTRNFSRPVRQTMVVTPPSEESKREVLDRNRLRWQNGEGSPQPKIQPRSSPELRGAASSPLPQIITPGISPRSMPSNNGDAYGGMPGGIDDDDDDHLGSEYVAVPRPTPNKLVFDPPAQLRTQSPSGLSLNSPQGPPPLLSHSSSLSSTSSGHSSHAPHTPQGLVPLPSHPPTMRASTPDSLYSNYSYYPLDGNTPPASATLSNFPSSSSQDLRNPGSSSSKPQLQKMPYQDLRVTSPKSKSASPDVKSSNPRTAEEYLALGISHHEANRLQESARCFEQAATLDGGCAVGMLMWGLALRHGWGVPKDEPKAFKWLKRAAEHAVVDLQEGSGRYAREAVKVCYMRSTHVLAYSVLMATKNELVLAVYEVGQCFFRGWGVPKDKEMGVVSIRVYCTWK